MVEEMYQQELNEAECATEDRERNQSNSNSGNQTQTPPTSSATEPPPPTPTRKRSDINPHENDPSIVSINRQHSFSENQAMQSTTVSEVVPSFDSDMA
ncbi:BEL1-like homeodomain protein, partial [Trifolium medium]|nr:BEL1-like homeodomain protein [Trifolium medium]